MKVVKAVVEKGKDGYWIYFENLKGCFSYGKSIAEAMENSKEAVKEFIEVSLELKEELPKVLKGEFKFEYKADIKSFFKEFEVLNMSAIARRSKINPSLLRQYAIGKKNPSIAQTKKIENSIHLLAKELLAVQF
jgi:predicted RNase H-like HicB family nuclease